MVKAYVGQKKRRYKQDILSEFSSVSHDIVSIANHTGDRNQSIQQCCTGERCFYRRQVFQRVSVQIFNIRQPQVKMAMMMDVRKAAGMVALGATGVMEMAHGSKSKSDCSVPGQFLGSDCVSKYGLCKLKCEDKDGKPVTVNRLDQVPVDTKCTPQSCAGAGAPIVATCTKNGDKSTSTWKPKPLGCGGDADGDCDDLNKGGPGGITWTCSNQFHKGSHCTPKCQDSTSEKIQAADPDKGTSTLTCGG